VLPVVAAVVGLLDVGALVEPPLEVEPVVAPLVLGSVELPVVGEPEVA